MRDEYDIQCLNPRRAPYAGELKKADGDGWTTWDDVRDKLFTPEEVAASDSRVGPHRRAYQSPPGKRSC